MRIRTIKPEFWFDEKTGQMSLEAVVVFLALLNMADDHGNLRADTRLIRGQLFPYRPTLDIDGAITECVGLGLLRPYEVRGQAYLSISNFLKHQKINRPSTGKLLPQPHEGQFTEASNDEKQPKIEASLSNNGWLTEDSLSHHGGLSVGREGKGRERKGREIAQNDEKSEKPIADATAPKGSRASGLTAQLVEAFQKARGAKYLHQKGKDGEALKELMTIATDEEVVERFTRGLTASGWLRINTIAQLRQKWNDLAKPTTSGHTEKKATVQLVDPALKHLTTAERLELSKKNAPIIRPLKERNPEAWAQAMALLKAQEEKEKQREQERKQSIEDIDF
jgi:hypothetical protein